MKPKFRRFLKKALPVFIVVPAMMQVSKATVYSGLSGNEIVVTGGNDTWRADSSNAPLTLTIANGVTLYGDPGNSFFSPIQVITDGYTIINNGTLSPTTGTAGINAGFPFFTDDVTILNNGTIDATNLTHAVAGIIVNDGATITNAGGITGIQNGIQAGSDLLLNNNAGTIRGINGPAVSADWDLTVNNAEGATITSDNDDGISANKILLLDNAGSINADGGGDAVSTSGDAVRIVNREGGSISGRWDGLDIGGNLISLDNSGSINGSGGQGVDVDDNATITNNESGSIHGGNDGIRVGSDLILTNSGVIDSVIYDDGPVDGGDGVDVGQDATITNTATGSISGYQSGLDISDNLTLTNDGSITGFNSDAVYAGGRTTITNNGDANGLVTTDGDGKIVSANSAGIYSGGPLTLDNHGDIVGLGGPGVIAQGVAVITNDGLIQGSGIEVGAPLVDPSVIDFFFNTTYAAPDYGNAIVLNGGPGNLVNLNDGSIVNGNIDGGFGDTLTFTGGLENCEDPTANVVNGNVSMDSVIKNDVGAAFMDGPTSDVHGNHFVNDVTVNGGALYINGTLGSLREGTTEITVNGNTQLDHSGHISESEVGGDGFWEANVTFNSTNGAAGISAGAVPIYVTGDAIDPTKAIGTLYIEGDVTHDSGSFIRYDVQPLASQALGPVEVYGGDVYDYGASDYLSLSTQAADLILHGQNQVVHTYDLGENTVVRISPTDVNHVLANGRYVVVDSDQEILGNASFALQFNNCIVDTDCLGTETRSQSANFNAVILNFVERDFSDSTQLAFTIDHDYEGLASSLHLSHNQQHLGAAIDASVGDPDPHIQDFIAALDYSDISTMKATFTALDPAADIALVESIINSNYRLHRLAENHLADIRESCGSAPMPVADAKGGKGGMAPAPAPAPCVGTSGLWNVWGTLSYDHQDYSGDFGSHDYDGDVGSFTAGIDYRVAEKLVLGLMLDGSTSNDLGSSSGEGSVDSFRIAAYGTWGCSTGLYSDFLIGYGTHDLDRDRIGGINCVSFGNGSTDADSFQALGTIGYNFGDDCLKHGPFAGLEYQKVDVDGLNSFPVSVGSYDAESLRGLIGYRVNAHLGTFRPYGSIAYAHEFEDDPITATARFGSAPFWVTGSERGSAILLALGTGIGLTDSLTLDVGYRGDIAVDSEGITSHGGSIGLNYNF